MVNVQFSSTSFSVDTAISPTLVLQIKVDFCSDLLQIVMVSPEAHLVKQHESQFGTNEPQLKRRVRKLKMLGPLCNQTANLKTDSKTLDYSILKLKYDPSI